MSIAADTQMDLELREKGFVHVHGLLDRRRYFEIACRLGAIISEETIALRPGAHAYVAKSGRVPLHTDHPQVDLIGWLCEEQDDVDGASLLLDAQPLVASMHDDQREQLYQVGLMCPPLAGGPPTERWPVLRPNPGGDAVFCSPWLRAADAIEAHEAALERFRTALRAYRVPHSCKCGSRAEMRSSSTTAACSTAGAASRTRAAGACFVFGCDGRRHFIAPRRRVAGRVRPWVEVVPGSAANVSALDGFACWHYAAAD